MQFAEKIKQIRTKNHLTQEQFAMRLNVTRQAVSNWENNRNLPDIQMLILITEIFDVTLDELILGDEKMNLMSEKLIEDTNQTKRAKLNLVTTLTGTILLLLGIVCLVIKALSVEYIDDQGILHENFFLLPIGFSLLFAGCIVFLVTGIRFLKERVHKNRA